MGVSATRFHFEGLSLYQRVHNGDMKRRQKSRFLLLICLFLCAILQPLQSSDGGVSTELQEQSQIKSREDLQIQRHCDAIRKELSIGTNQKPIPDSSAYRFANWWQKYWQPTFACHNEERIMQHLPNATSSDGGKWVCNVPTTPRTRGDGEKCLVYSFGSCGDFSFEYGVHARKGCEIHTFDPIQLGTPESPNPDANMTDIHSHSIGLGPYDMKFTPSRVGDKAPYPMVTMRKLSTIVRELGHKGRHIDILKIDIDGLEFGLVDTNAFWAELEAPDVQVTVGQLLIEVHFQGINNETFRFRDAYFRKVPPKTGEEMDDFFRTLTRPGLGDAGYSFVMFHKEVNMAGVPAGDASEFSFIRQKTNCGVTTENYRFLNESSFHNTITSYDYLDGPMPSKEKPAGEIDRELNARNSGVQYPHPKRTPGEHHQRSHRKKVPNR